MSVNIYYISYIQNMHSQYLNQYNIYSINRNKICQFFTQQQQQHDTGPRRQNQVSLNLTATSRDSHHQYHHQQQQGQLCRGGRRQQQQYHSHVNSNINTNSNSNTNNNNMNNNSNSNNMNLAMKQLDKFNNWLYGFTKKNDGLLMQVTNLLTNVQQNNSNSVLLSMPDLSLLNNNNNNSKNIQAKNNTNNLQQCQQCIKKLQLIQIINQQHNIKVNQCNQIKIQMQCIQAVNIKESIQAIHQKLLVSVQNNLIIDKNVQLESIIGEMKCQLERNKLQKSVSMQKSNSLLKTKDLQRRLESGPSSSSYIPHANSTSNYHLRCSFSNAKNSTNPSNDTMNRISSIINFQNCQPNLDQLIKYFEDELSVMKSRCRQIVSQQQKKKGQKMQGISRKKLLGEQPEHKLYGCYHQICKNMAEVKVQKQRYGDRLSSNSIRRSRNKLQTTQSQSNLETTSTTIIASGQLKQLKNTLRCLQGQVNNLKDTNDDLVVQLAEITQNLREKIGQCQSKSRQSKKLDTELKSIYQRYLKQSKQRKRASYLLEEMKGKIRVYCRIRPKIGDETKCKSFISHNNQKIIVGNEQFEFNQIFNDKTTQHDIFEEVRGLVEYAYDGRNLCLLAYGQMNSGKTYTLHGNNQEPGLSRMIIEQLFDHVDKQRKKCDVVVAMGVLQIHRQSIRDLNRNSELTEDSNEIHLQKSMRIKVSNSEQLLEAYYLALNRRSSSDNPRSHCIFTIYLQIFNKKTKQQRSSKISLVDLARPQKILSSNPLVNKQNQFINKSLSNLINTIATLNTYNRQQLPIKQCKQNRLTYLLKDHLTYRSRIVLFINISHNQKQINETISSLMYGVQAWRVVKNKSKQSSENILEKGVTVTRRSSSRLSVC